MATFTGALARVKSDLDKYLPAAWIEGACRNAGHRWRRRQFDPVTTLRLFVLQILWHNAAMTQLRHLAGMPVNAAAYCQARMRLPLAALEALLEYSAQAMAPDAQESRWCGLRCYLVDASSALAPDTPANQKCFPQPKGQKKGCGFPVPKLLGLFDAGTGLLIRMIFAPLYTHDLRGMPRLHPKLGPGDLLVGDRAFCSFAHLALLLGQQVQGLFRLHASRKSPRPRRRGSRGSPQAQGRRSPSATRVWKRLGKHDHLVVWQRPRECYLPAWLRLRQFRQLPATLTLRQVSWSLPAQGQRTRRVTIVTTLLDPALYPPEKLAELYGVRWTIETHFRELKTTLGMRRLKSQTPAGLQKEMLVFGLVYNLIHAVMWAAAQRQQVPAARISFVDALRWLLTAPPGAPLPDLRVNPPRPGRHQPRVVKDRHDGYQRMTQPRWKMNRHPEKWPGRK